MDDWQLLPSRSESAYPVSRGLARTGALSRPPGGTHSFPVIVSFAKTLPPFPGIPCPGCTTDVPSRSHEGFCVGPYVSRRERGPKILPLLP